MQDNNRLNGKLVLLDGHSILNRAFYGIPGLQTTAGVHTNAVYGFLSILFKVLADEKPTHLAVAFDVKAPTFRHEIYKDYKGTRKPMPEELREQVPLIRDVLNAMQVLTVEKAGLEADDLIGTIARRAEKSGLRVLIVSGDRDLLQLVTDQVTVQLAKPRRGGSESENFTPERVKEEFEVTPDQIVDLKALMGDSSDNIPGLPGVGLKTAQKLIAQFETLENAKAHMEELKPNKVRLAFEEHYDLALLSKELATICVDADISFSLEEAVCGNLFTAAAYELFKDLEFKQFLSNFEDQVSMQVQETQLQIQTVTDNRKWQQILSACSKQTQVGLALLTDDVLQTGSVQMSLFEQTELQTGVPRLACAAIAIEKTQYILQSEALGEKSVRRMIGDLLKRAGCLASFSVKLLYRIFPRKAVEQLPLFDVHLAAYLLNPLKSVYEYDDLASAYLNIHFAGAKELQGQTERRLASEALCALMLCDPLNRELEQANMKELYDQMELPLTSVLADMESDGIFVEREQLSEYGRQLGTRLADLEQEIYALAGETFNIQSPKQLGEILFDKLKLPGGKKTKTGYSTAVDVLEKLSGEYEIVNKVLEFRQYAKLKSTYADGLSAFIDADGRIRSTFHQTITATGRISSAEPNLQNIPIRTELGRLLRRVFVAGPGCVFIDADYSQIELRVLAHLSGDDALIQAFCEDQDIHTLTASQVFHVAADEVTPLLRRHAKAVNFGIVYGISAFGLSQDLHISQKEAKQYIDQYFQTYPKVHAYLEQQVSAAKQSGYSHTMYQRRRPVPEIRSSNFMQRSFGERVAMNSPIQGTAADIIKLAMIAVHDRLIREGLSSRLVLQVHDELLVETREEEKEQVWTLVKEEMEHAANLSVPLVADMSVGKNWYETK